MRNLPERKEITRLLKELRDRKGAARNYSAIRLMTNTGLRVSELVSVNVGDVQGLKAYPSAVSSISSLVQCYHPGSRAGT